jgi:hypothetical protein
LAAIKQVVLHTAQQQIVAAAAAGGVAIAAPAAVFGGVLAMKKVLIGCVLIALAGICWWFAAPPPGDAPTDSVTATPLQAERAAVDSEPTARHAVAAEHDSTPRTAAPSPIEHGRMPTPTELWGRVVDAATKAPIADADIDLLHRPADEFWNLDLDYGAQIASLARTRTDGDGGFRFDVERARPHRLRVRADGYAPATELGNTGGSIVEIALARGASLHGVVKSGERLIAGAEVEVAVRGESLEIGAARTDAAGRFHFSDLPAVPVYVQVSSSLFEEAWEKLDLVAGEDHALTIEIPAGRELRGRVLDDATGEPILNAAVSESWTQKRCVRTDAEGKFTLAGLQDHDYVMLHVHAAGYASWSQNVGKTLADERVVRLARGGEIVGRLLDASGRAVTDAYLAVSSTIIEAPGMHGSDWLRAQPGTDGRFRAIGLRTDSAYSLMARAKGYGTRVYRLPRTLATGERLDVGDIVLRAAGGIEGVVVDEHGAPCAHASVGFEGSNADVDAWVTGTLAGEPPTQFLSHRARANAAGVFRISGLAAGTYQLSARLPGLEDSNREAVTVDEGVVRDGVRLAVVRGQRLTGTVIRADGQPLDGAQREQLWLQVSDPRGWPRSIAMDTAGAFAIEGVTGVVTLTALRTPSGWSLAPHPLAAGTLDARVVLQRSSFVAGQVVDANGMPTKARVTARAAEDQSSMLHATDDAGRFRIEVPSTFVGKVNAYPLTDDPTPDDPVDARAGDEQLRPVLRLPGR